jgi:hypothetical protein
MISAKESEVSAFDLDGSFTFVRFFFDKLLSRLYNDDTRVKRSCVSCLHEKA